MYLVHFHHCKRCLADCCFVFQENLHVCVWTQMCRSIDQCHMISHCPLYQQVNCPVRKFLCADMKQSVDNYWDVPISVSPPHTGTAADTALFHCVETLCVSWEVVCVCVDGFLGGGGGMSVKRFPTSSPLFHPFIQSVSQSVIPSSTAVVNSFTLFHTHTHTSW